MNENRIQYLQSIANSITGGDAMNKKKDRVNVYARILMYLVMRDEGVSMAHMSKIFRFKRINDTPYRDSAIDSFMSYANTRNMYLMCKDAYHRRFSNDSTIGELLLKQDELLGRIKLLTLELKDVQSKINITS